MPEFARVCPESVAISDGAESADIQLQRIIKVGHKARYDILPYSHLQALRADGELINNMICIDF